MIKKICLFAILILLLIQASYLALLEPITKLEKISLSRGLVWYNKVFLQKDLPITQAPLAAILDIIFISSFPIVEKIDPSYKDFLSYVYLEGKLNSLISQVNQGDLLLVRMKNFVIFLVLLLSHKAYLGIISLISREFLLTIMTQSQLLLTLFFTLLTLEFLIKNFRFRSFFLASLLGVILSLLLAAKASFFLVIMILASAILTMDFMHLKLHKGFTKVWVANCCLTIFISLFTLWLIYAAPLVSLKKLGQLFTLNLPDIRILPFYEPLKSYLFSLIFPSDIAPTSWSVLQIIMIILNLLIWIFAARRLQKEKKYYLFAQGILTSFLLIFSAFSNETKFFIDMASLQSIILLPNLIKFKL